MQGAYCIVTGANAGIGKEIAAGLMSEGAHVVMACRNMDACDAAKKQLEERRLPGSCECCRLDLADKDSIRSFAKEQQRELRRRRQPLRILVNNAGVMGLGPGPSGEDQHLSINHLGPFLLTNLLRPTLADGSRVVNVSSRASLLGHVAVRGGEIVPGPQFWLSQYARSKLCNVAFTAELRRRLGSGILCTSVSPGFVATNIFRSVPPSVAWLLQAVAPVLGKTPADGAKTAIFAATSPSLAESKPTPLLLHECKPMRPPRLAEDEQLVADLWAASAAAVGWSESE